MVLVERSTVLPLDLVVLINSFLYERLTDENFHEAIALWFGNEKECKFRFGHISDWNTSRVTNIQRRHWSMGCGKGDGYGISVFSSISIPPRHWSMGCEQCDEYGTYV
jgi:hypothetical protein